MPQRVHPVPLFFPFLSIQCSFLSRLGPANICTSLRFVDQDHDLVSAHRCTASGTRSWRETRKDRQEGSNDDLVSLITQHGCMCACVRLAGPTKQMGKTG